MHVIVLGAGLLGVTSAYFLRQQGHDVTVVDRQATPAAETSFANGGQISVSHAEPWANPGTPAKIVEWLGREDAPLLFRLRADWHQWTWALRFLAECLPFRTRDNIRQILALALYSRAELQRLRRDTGIEYDQLMRGILHFYTDAEEFEHAGARAELMRQYGCELDVKTAEQCLAIEPALAHAADDIVGGTYAAADESGDARKFTERLAALATGQGVGFQYGRSIKRLEAHRGRIISVVLADAEGRDDRISADAYVVALGSYSPLLLRPLGISIPVYPLKGYSITVPLEPGDEAPTVSLTDDSHKLVYSRLGDRLRVAGTAEVAGYNTDVNDVRCQAIVQRAFEIFPRAGRPERAEFWTGLRPATPSNVPVIGRTKLANLFVNTGHGTLGWTMACGSGRALADIVSGRQPEPEFRFAGLPARPRSVLVAKPAG